MAEHLSTTATWLVQAHDGENWVTVTAIPLTTALGIPTALQQARETFGETVALRMLKTTTTVEVITMKGYS